MMAQQQGGSVNWYRTSTASTVPAQNTDPSSAMDEQQKQSRLSDVPFPNIPLRSLMKRVRLMKSAGKLESLRQLADEPDAGEDKKNIFDDDSEEGELVVGGQTDVLLNGASALNELFNEEIEDESTTGYSYSQASTEDEDAPMLPILVGDEGQGYGSVKQNQAKRKKKRKKKRKPWYRRCQPRSQGILEIVNPVTLAKGILRFLFGSSFTYVSVPCLLAAFLFFYFMGDPEFDFLPGNATASWWFLFGARQAITLEVAIAVEHILVEGLALRTKCFVYMMGPLLTLGLIQARGWPVVAVLWSLLDMLILHGNDAFQRNWLFFTGVRLFSSEKDSAGTIILDSDLYLRFLSAMLLVGSCHAIKRTFLALAFGRRSLVSYKRKLELIVADVFIVTEVAELSKELEVLDTMSAATAVKGKDRSWKGTLKVDFQGTAASALTDSPIRDDSVLPAQDHLADERIPEDLSEDDYEEEGEDEEDEEGEVEDEEDNGDEVIEIQDYSSMQPSHASLKKQAKSISLRPRDGSVTSASSGTGRLKSMLERWEDPESKLRKSESASIGDILNFRKALTYLDSPCVFGDAFGNTTSRDDCIKSAQKAYRRILRCTNTSILQFDVIGLLSMSEDGNVDEVKDFALRRVFNPDKENQLSLFAFVQSCDTVYKRVRFFRAAVKNSSIINNVLEDIVDGVVNFVLFLIVLPMLQVNPYPVLVSVSTLLVSFAFAVGSSASSYIEVRIGKIVGVTTLPQNTSILKAFPGCSSHCLSSPL
jgi:hypothetical protein